MGKIDYNLDKSIEAEIISLAKNFGVNKLILFGSRARVSNHERSDIDLAAQGGNFFEFAAAVEEKIETLLSFDIVNLDDDLPENFKAEIYRDGIILFEDVPVAVKKFDAFDKSLSILLRSKHEIEDEIYRMGIIGQFNLTFELSWKALREFLMIHGVSEAISGSPREIIKAGYKFNFIHDENIWLNMLNQRNRITHIYDEKIALELVDSIFDKYFSALIDLREELNKRRQEL